MKTEKMTIEEARSVYFKILDVNRSILTTMNRFIITLSSSITTIIIALNRDSDYHNHKVGCILLLTALFLGLIAAIADILSYEYRRGELEIQIITSQTRHDKNLAENNLRFSQALTRKKRRLLKLSWWVQFSSTICFLAGVIAFAYNIIIM